MKKRKLVAMLLAMCMVFSLAACGNSGGSSSSSSTSSEGGDSGSAENSDDSASSGAETGSFDDVITLTADSDGDPFTWDPSTDEMAAFIEENFGIAFQQSETNYYNNDFTVTQLAATDGTLPKVFCADILYYPQEITQFIPEGLVAEIPEELLDKYPLTKALLENDAVAQTVYGMYDGYYFLPKPDSADPDIYKAERKGIFIRTDWLDAVGMDMPTTWEDLYNVCHAFTYDDPDGNGVNDTYGLTGDGMGTLRYFFASTGVSNRYWNKDADGNWFFGALDDSNIEVLEWLRKMWEDGTIDPDFGASTWENGLQKFSSNTFGMCVRNADANWINDVAVKYYGAANPGVNPFDRIDVIPALAMAEGETPRMDGYTSCMVATMFSESITEEEMDRFLNYYEYLLSEEGQYLRMGFEGEDWERNDDGSISLIRDENGNATVMATKYPCSTVTHWPSWGFELAAYENVEYFDEYNDETKAMNAAACAIRNEDPVYPEVGPMLIDDTTVTDTTAFSFNSEYWQIITGTEPVADMFADMKERAMASGFTDAEEVVAEYAEEYGW
ncbi:MAG TPA: extracellular solute-binding protein [Candidatus Eisenbergiella stercoravium]|nr:extracellular solute-binding protein [Candidatus Eisenbergiella stercoravium]